MSTSSSKRSRTSSSSSTTMSGRQSTSLPKTEITINVYDLLPPGRLSTLLWTFGSSLLHTGVVIANREYAYGGHNKRHTTGVYYTRPRLEPPGGTFRCSILQGFSFLPATEVEGVIKEVSEQFLGERYNLLQNNCNHFTSALCERLTGRAAPGWVNRAASVGLALPCVVPREWIAPPDCETAEGELLDGDEEEEDDEDERAAMLEGDRRRRRREAWGRRQQQVDGGESSEEEDEELGCSLAGGGRIMDSDSTPPPRLVSVRDNSGWAMPVAERAPVPKRL